MDIDPIHEGHVLIVPKQHIDSIEKLSDDEIIDNMGVARKIVVALKYIYGNDGYSIMQNGGKCCDYVGHILRVSQSILRGLQRKLGKIVEEN